MTPWDYFYAILALLLPTCCHGAVIITLFLTEYSEKLSTVTTSSTNASVVCVLQDVISALFCRLSNVVSYVRS